MAYFNIVYRYDGSLQHCLQLRWLISTLFAAAMAHFNVVCRYDGSFQLCLQLRWLISTLFIGTMAHFNFENTVAELTRLDAPLNVKPPTGWRRRPPSTAEGQFSGTDKEGIW